MNSSEAEKKKVLEEYAQTSEADRIAAKISYDKRKEFIDKNLTSEMFKSIVTMFMPQILEKRALDKNPTLETQLVQIVYPSSSALERRMKGKIDEPILGIGFLPIKRDDSILKVSPAAKTALASKNKTTLICICTFMPTSMLPGGGPDSVVYHSITGMDL
jgi:hypothetical protein